MAIRWRIPAAGIRDTAYTYSDMQWHKSICSWVCVHERVCRHRVTENFTTTNPVRTSTEQARRDRRPSMRDCEYVCRAIWSSTTGTLTQRRSLTQPTCILLGLYTYPEAPRDSIFHESRRFLLTLLGIRTTLLSIAARGSRDRWRFSSLCCLFAPFLCRCYPVYKVPTRICLH